MEFVNHFKNIKKTDKNLYGDLELAYAEYEYIRQVLKSKISNILLKEISDSSQFFIDITDACIEITIEGTVSLSIIRELDRLLGIDGIIKSVGKKKSSKVRLIFEKVIDIQYDENLSIIE